MAAPVLHRKPGDTVHQPCVTLSFEERFMSLSVNGSNTNNPAALWQSLLPQGSSASGTCAVRSAVGTAGGARPGHRRVCRAASSSTSATSSTPAPRPHRVVRPRNSARRRCRRCLPCRPMLDVAIAWRRSSTATDRRTRPIRVRRSNPSRVQGQHAHHHHHHAGGAAERIRTCLPRLKERHQPDHRQHQWLIDDHHHLCRRLERDVDDGAAVGAVPALRQRHGFGRRRERGGQ